VKTSRKIILAIGIGAAALVGSLLVTYVAWELLIEASDFHCTDVGLSEAFWMSAATHEGAGDKIMLGWTWEKLQLVNDLYKFAFFALWTYGGVLWYRRACSAVEDCSPQIAEQRGPHLTASRPTQMTRNNINFEIRAPENDG
jgi:hypothetical protein